MQRGAAITAFALSGLLALVLALAVVLLATGTLQAYAVPSSAMEPTLHCARPAPGCAADQGDRVLALTRFASYGRGDLVVIDSWPTAEARCGVSGRYVKRVIALPGETIALRRIRRGAHVFLDGSRLPEPYVEGARRDRRTRRPFTVPPGHVFVLGDNRAQSCDSRHFGPVHEDDVVGRLVATYWPPGRISIR